MSLEMPEFIHYWKLVQGVDHVILFLLYLGHCPTKPTVVRALLPSDAKRQKLRILWQSYYTNPLTHFYILIEWKEFQGFGKWLDCLSCSIEHTSSRWPSVFHKRTISDSHKRFPLNPFRNFSNSFTLVRQHIIKSPCLLLSDFEVPQTATFVSVYKELCNTQVGRWLSPCF